MYILKLQSFKKIRGIKNETCLDFNYVKPCFDLLQFRNNFMTKGFSNLDRFVTTLTSTINFLTRWFIGSNSVLYMKQNM